MLTLHIQSRKPLPEIAKTLSSLFSLGSIQEHESSNYPDGVYFSASGAMQQMKVAADDYVGFDDYDYEVHLKRTGDVEQKDVEDLARKLLQVSPTVARRVEHKPDRIVREVYRLDASGELNREQQTIALRSH